MEKSKIFKSLKNKMLIIKYTGRFSFVCSNQRNERKRNEGRKNDWFEIATNRQSNRPTDNRYFFKFYALSIFFPSIILEGLISRQVPWFKFCRLKRFSCFTLRTVVAIACWLTISEKYCRKFSPEPCFHSHLTNTSLINVPHRAICVVAIAIFISSSFPFFFSHSTMFLRFLIAKYPSESISYLVSKMLKINRQSCN